MSTVYIPSEILDTASVMKRIGAGGTPQEVRLTACAVLKEAYAHGRETIQKRFHVLQKGGVAIAEYAYLIDSIVQVLYGLALAQYPAADVAVVAVGGYGRSELFPYSDIDLLFLHRKKQDACSALVQWMLYGLWDIGLTLGQAMRTVPETIDAAGEDVTVRTTLLDARQICGNAALYGEFSSAFEQSIESHSAADFVEAKLKERNERHLRVGDSRYVLEPNVKEGKGGLRDLHTLWWLVRYIYHLRSFEELVNLSVLTESEYKIFIKARDFLWRVRMHLHLIAGRAEERLTFDKQPAVAEAMGYRDDGNARAVERFMKAYFLVARDVGSLTRSVCAVLEEDKKRKPRLGLGDRMQTEARLGEFRLDGERIAVASEDAFEAKPVLLITLFEAAHEHGLDIHPHTLQLVSRSLWLIDASLRRNTDANDAFMHILLSKRNPEPTLRRMSEAGVLGRFIPDFGRVMGQMQFDMYHVYTVDEHTIFAIGILHGIGTGKFREEMPITSEIIHQLQSRRVLFLALFAHDIAKGRGGDHSMLGEMVVRKLARRFGFEPHEVENCAWLVRHHLLMSRTAFKRDLTDAKTIEDFVAHVQSPERLRLLLILTVADIRAVGPTVWNGWKGALLRDLYYRAEEKMGGSDTPLRIREQASLKEELKALLPDWKAREVDDYLEQGGSSFWGSCDAATHARIARIMREAQTSGQPLVLNVRSDPFHAITDVALCAPDSHGLFSRISGAIALAGATILSAKIFTFKNGYAVELFHLQDIDNKAFDKPDKLARLNVFINKAVMGELDIDREIAATRLPYPSRMEAFKVPPRVFIENKASSTHTVIEVGGRDRIGFLHHVTRVLVELGLTISTAHITTYGERAVDVFYVKDAFGMKVLHESKLRQMQEKLTEALSAAAEKPRQAV
jgi:[protein-PII] uridylyltransferase